MTEMPIRARLGWKLEREQLIYDTGEDGVQHEEQIIRFKPDMPWLEPGDSEWVLDFYDLLRSAQTPEDYFVLTCSCGDAGHADINESVCVTHPSADVIAWHLGWKSYGGFISADIARSADALVLHFDRAQYEADLQAMWREVQATHQDLPVYELQPDSNSAWTQFKAEIGNTGLLRAVPLLTHPGELVFAMEGMGYCWLNGKQCDGNAEELLPNGATRGAFRDWMSYVKREYGFSAERVHASWLVLKREQDRTACNAAGERLVALLRQAWAQSNPPVEAQVLFRPCTIAAVQ
jgi:hypothetical protein